MTVSTAAGRDEGKKAEVVADGGAGCEVGRGRDIASCGRLCS